MTFKQAKANSFFTSYAMETSADQRSIRSTKRSEFFFLNPSFRFGLRSICYKKIRYYRISTMYSSYTMNTSVTDVFFVVFGVEHTLPIHSSVNSVLFLATMCDIEPYIYIDINIWPIRKQIAIAFFIIFGHITEEFFGKGSYYEE